MPGIHEAKEHVHARPELGDGRRLCGDGVVQELHTFVAVGIHKMERGPYARRDCLVFQVVPGKIAEKFSQRFRLKAKSANFLPHVSEMEYVLALARPVVVAATGRQVQKEEPLVEKQGQATVPCVEHIVVVFSPSAVGVKGDLQKKPRIQDHVPPEGYFGLRKLVFLFERSFDLPVEELVLGPSL